jgi:hypothetical protein
MRGIPASPNPTADHMLAPIFGVGGGYTPDISLKIDMTPLRQAELFLSLHCE